MVLFQTFSNLGENRIDEAFSKLLDPTSIKKIQDKILPICSLPLQVTFYKKKNRNIYLREIWTIRDGVSYWNQLPYLEINYCCWKLELTAVVGIAYIFML